MKKQTIIVLSAIIIAILAVLTVYSRTHITSSTTIKIGAALTLSGDGAVWGEASRNAAKLAVSEINSAGGVNGRQLELLIEDTESTSKGSVSAVSKMQNVDGADAFIASWLDVYQGAESILKPGQIMITPDGGVEAVNGARVHSGVFSTWYRTQPKSDLILKYMHNQGKKRLYLIAQNDSYYSYTVNYMASEAKKLGIEIVGQDLVNSDSDMRTILAKVTSYKADAVWFGLYDDKATFSLLKRRAEFSDRGVSFYGDELVQQNLSRADYKGLLEDIYFYTPRKPDASFYDKYVSMYGKEPVFGAAPTYDAVYMIARVLKDNPTNIDAYMRSTNFKTVSYGDVKFDDIGGVTTDSNYFTIKQVKGGEAIAVKM